MIDLFMLINCISLYYFILIIVDCKMKRMYTIKISFRFINNIIIVIYNIKFSNKSVS